MNSAKEIPVSKRVADARRSRDKPMEYGEKRGNLTVIFRATCRKAELSPYSLRRS